MTGTLSLVKKERFTAELLEGHKEAALEVPFDPAERWSAPQEALRPGRRGHRVSGTLNGVAFESAIVRRSRRFFLLVGEELQGQAKLEPGDTVKVAVQPAGKAKPGPPIGPARAAQEFERVRRICLALPEVEEKLAWSEPTFRVGGRVFLMFSNNHHHDGRIAFWCPAPEGMQKELVSSDPKNLFVPPYVGPGGWIGVRIDSGLPQPAIAAFVQQAYHLIAAKRKTPRRRR
jgi:predicted DNA-binding protein (MmcQ/YjbR family)